MCFRLRFVLIFVLLAVSACTSYVKVRQMRSGQLKMGLSVREDSEYVDEPDVVVDTVAAQESQGPIFMNAIRDSETGEMVATDVISASRVVARFRNVPERGGYVTIGFDIMVPGRMMESRWQLKIHPQMRLGQDTVRLEPVYITGKDYRKAQLRGYQRYQAFLASIITDTTDLVRMRLLEIFIERNFPDTYRMKNDSSVVPEPLAQSLFGVTQADALRHYTRHWRAERNESKKRNKGDMFRRFVRDSIVHEGLRLDTVMTGSGDFIYQYNHTFKSRPLLKKVGVSLNGDLYEDGRRILTLAYPDDLTFYISSLSSLADDSPRYKMIVLERQVFDHTKALIDFESGSAVVDTLRGDNASELSRVLRCVGQVGSRGDLELDSLVIAASCSPEGAFEYNRRLSQSRSAAVVSMLGRHLDDSLRMKMRASCVPENWEQLRLLVRNDSSLNRSVRRQLMDIMSDLSRPDDVEGKMSRMKEYRYLREHIYPQLRSVTFEFFMHRRGMVKDTVHTTVPDTVYMSGLRAMRQMDYKRAVEILRPYGDYNAALAYVSSGYNHSALQVLEGLDSSDPRVCYLMSMVLSRLGRDAEALGWFEKALVMVPAMEFRANLDPEMSELVKIRSRKYDVYESY